MFSKNHMTVGNWWVFYLLMLIPIVNVVLYIVLLLSKDSNKSLKSYLWATILPIIIVIILFFSLGLGSFILAGN